MDRRNFVRQLGLGLAAAWAWGKLARPLSALAGPPEVRLALLADAHLKNSGDGSPEARALIRAVADIKALRPGPDIVLFAGDLAHKGRPDALDLGREILADLRAPVWAVRGEGDQGPGGDSAWVRRFGDPWFSRTWGDFHLVGLDTVCNRTPKGTFFEIGAAQRQWLARELAGLDHATPLIILSHAPLARLFYPWQQWTEDGPEVARLLEQFSTVICLHGHVHGTGEVGEEVLFTPTLTLPHQGGGKGAFSRSISSMAFSAGLRHYGLPATAWPGPLALQGTPAVRRPASGPRGCGWALITLSAASHPTFQPYLWQA